MTEEELLAAIKASGSEDPTAPIGVPEGYVPPIRSNTGFSPGPGPSITPDDLRPAPYLPSDALRFAGAAPETIVAVQQQLVDAGLLRGRFQAGVWDSTSQAAYKSLLGYANQLGTTDEFALRRWQATGMGETEPETARQPFVAQVSNPLDIKSGLRDFFRDHLGSGDIDETKLDAMVKAYQGEEVSAQQQAYDLNETGGTVTQAPSFATFADEAAKQHDRTAYDSTKVVERFDRMAELLRGAE